MNMEPITCRPRNRFRIGKAEASPFRSPSIDHRGGETGVYFFEDSQLGLVLTGNQQERAPFFVVVFLLGGRGGLSVSFDRHFWVPSQKKTPCQDLKLLHAGALRAILRVLLALRRLGMGS